MGDQRGQRAKKSGVRAESASSIIISFSYQGVRCRERIKLKPTAINLKAAERHREAILDAIFRGTFDYTFTFPDSPNAVKFAKQEGDIVTISQYLQKWHAGRKNFLKASTHHEYKNTVFNTLIPAFGNISLSELKRKDIKDWVNQQTAGPKRINNVMSVLRKALSDAVDDEMIEANPLYGWNYAPKEQLKTTDDVDPFSQQEQVAILANAPNDFFRNLFQFAFWTGLRTSELIALDWGDIDFINNQIFITKAITTASNGVPEVPKTKSGNRRVKLLPPALSALHRQKKISFLGRNAIFTEPRTKERISGNQRIRDVWEAILKRAGVRYRRPYQTRHTYASMMLSAGENPMWVASQMGHSDWTMIARIYGKWIPSANPTAGDKAVAIFSEHVNIHIEKPA